MIYFLQSPAGGRIKIGTAVDVDIRHKQLEAHYRAPATSTPTPIRVVPTRRSCVP